MSENLLTKYFCPVCKAYSDLAYTDGEVHRDFMITHYYFHKLENSAKLNLDKDTK